MIQLVVKAEDTVIEGILAAAQAAGPDLLDQKDALKAALFWMEAAVPDRYRHIIDANSTCHTLIQVGNAPPQSA